MLPADGYDPVSSNPKNYADASCYTTVPLALQLDGYP